MEDECCSIMMTDDDDDNNHRLLLDLTEETAFILSVKIVVPYV